MFPGLGKYDEQHNGVTREIVDIEMACHGGSVIEIKKQDGKWRLVPDSKYARRITALNTQMAISGPAAGHPRLQTSADPTGTRVIGTINNCAGGITPWGTYLMAEENFHGYFSGNLDIHPLRGSADTVTTRVQHRWRPDRRAPGKDQLRTLRGAGRALCLGQVPQAFRRQRRAQRGQPLRLDRRGGPAGPDLPPVKRTALGRFKHEGAECIVNGDGRLVLYSRRRPALRVPLQIRLRRPSRSRQPRRQPGPAGPRDPLCRPSFTPTGPSPGYR